MTRTERPQRTDPAERRPASWFFGGSGHWRERLGYIVETMRELSSQTDPQEMVRAYGARMAEVLPSDRFVALSRRGLPAPQYRITRSSLWEDEVDPWASPDRLPLLAGGLLGQLVYGDEAVVINDLAVPDDDPAAAYFAGMRSLVAVPLFDGGVGVNMVVQMRKEPGAFRHEELPERVWLSNLFGRATQTLVLHQEVRKAYDAVDRELKAVADIQLSLLPRDLPRIPTLDLAAHYQTSRRAGGDYYDFFALPNGQWGLFMADVSGHGTPAAVLMAVTHSIAHTCLDPKTPPSRLMRFVNERLSDGYTEGGNFVTAFYGIYDPADRRLTYSNAGHPPPRVRRAGEDWSEELREAGSLPLGIDAGEPYADACVTLRPGDTLVLYTDGITEARTPAGAFFGTDRVDAAICQSDCGAAAVVADLLAAVDAFTGPHPPTDDRTLLVARVS